MRSGLLALAAMFVFGLPNAQAGAPINSELAPLQALFRTPEQQIDFAQAKLTVDRLIDPSIDAAEVLRELDQLTATVKQRTPAGLTKRAELDVLLDTLYKPGAWNGNKPFSYDLNDPFGKNWKNKLLATYLATRKGNCVSMPILVAILGQRLGLIMTLATAPEHVMVKFVDDEGRWLNVEATAGGSRPIAATNAKQGLPRLPSITKSICARCLRVSRLGSWLVH